MWQKKKNLSCLFFFSFLLHIRFWSLFIYFTLAAYYIWHFSPCYPSPTSLTLLYPSPIPPNRPQCVMLPSLCPYGLIVQHPPMSENMWCLLFCSCVSLLRLMVSSFIHVSAKDMNSSFFYGCIVFHGVYVTHFLYPGYHWWRSGLVPSLCCYEQCCNKHMCACVFIVEQFIILWTYTQ